MVINLIFQLVKNEGRLPILIQNRFNNEISKIDKLRLRNNQSRQFEPMTSKLIALYAKH